MNFYEKLFKLEGNEENIDNINVLYAIEININKQWKLIEEDKKD